MSRLRAQETAIEQVNSEKNTKSITVNGVDCLAKIDTGAEITVIARRMDTEDVMSVLSESTVNSSKPAEPNEDVQHDGAFEESGPSVKYADEPADGDAVHEIGNKEGQVVLDTMNSDAFPAQNDETKGINGCCMIATTSPGVISEEMSDVKVMNDCYVNNNDEWLFSNYSGVIGQPVVDLDGVAAVLEEPARHDESSTVAQQGQMVCTVQLFEKQPTNEWYVQCRTTLWHQDNARKRRADSEVNERVRWTGRLSGWLARAYRQLLLSSINGDGYREVIKQRSSTTWRSSSDDQRTTGGGIRNNNLAITVAYADTKCDDDAGETNVEAGRRAASGSRRVAWQRRRWRKQQ